MCAQTREGHGTRARARVRAGRMLDGQGLWWGMRLSSVRRLRHERATSKNVSYSTLVVDVTILCVLVNLKGIVPTALFQTPKGF